MRKFEVSAMVVSAHLGDVIEIIAFPQEGSEAEA
jgi:hypothetical protein